MFDFHRDKERYFRMQYLTARDHIIPFLGDRFRPGSRVLEIGCAEAGVLKAFVEQGCPCVGIELSEHRTQLAEAFHAEAVRSGQIRFLNKNIYDIDVRADFEAPFDLILLKDVIEHIPDQARFIPKLAPFLNPGGSIFFGFPPWYMPFGGHQQMSQSRILSKTPYFHLLPKGMYRAILRAFGDPEEKVRGLLEIKETGISIERFEAIVERSGFVVVRRKLFLLNPIYTYKFGVRPKEQWGVVAAIPYIRDFLSTAAYYVVEKGEARATRRFPASGV